LDKNPDTPVIASLRSRNPTVNEFVGRWSEQLSKARDCIQVAQQQQKQDADRHHRAALIYKPRDEVLLSIKQLRVRGVFKAKLAPRYVGPYKVLSNIGPNNRAYRISLPSHLSRMHNVFMSLLSNCIYGVWNISLRLFQTSSMANWNGRLTGLRLLVMKAPGDNILRIGQLIQSHNGNLLVI
jgi:hypothetical protein